MIKNSANIIEIKLESVPIDLIGSKILITGASGLIGIHLTEFFKKFSNNVYTLMKNSPPVYMKNIFERSNLIIGDVTKDELLDFLPTDFDYIIHSAGYATPSKFMDNQNETTQIGSYSTKRLFRKLKKRGNFLFISSSEIYGGVENPTENNKIVTNQKRECYIQAKVLGEQIVKEYFEKSYNAKSVRVCNAYGPGFKLGDQRALNTFIRQALLNKEIRLRDSGKDIRNYCYVSDIVTKMLNVCFYGKSSVYNIGSDDPDSLVTISELAEKIAKITNSIVIYPKVGGDNIGSPKCSTVSMNKYNNEFGKYFSIPLEDGLKETVDWCDYLIQYQQEYYNFTGEVIAK